MLCGKHPGVTRVEFVICTTTQTYLFIVVQFYIFKIASGKAKVLNIA